jgi:hypothetical protein
MKYRILLLMTSAILFSANAFAHGDEKHPKPEKVDSAMMQEKPSDTTHPEARDDAVTERDFATVRDEVQSSTTLIVIKALALAVAITGLGFVYIPRNRRESS